LATQVESSPRKSGAIPCPLTIGDQERQNEDQTGKRKTMIQELNWNAKEFKLEIMLSAKEILHFMQLQNDQDIIDIIWEYLECNKRAKDAIQQRYYREEQGV
jgi:hypothetical protein